jgi:hypothetical protein
MRPVSLSSMLRPPRIVALVGLLLPAVGRAQQTSQDSSGLPFHRGQWAAQFAIDGGFAGIGALRFRSPSSAWLLDSRAALRDSRSDSNDAAKTTDVQGDVLLRVGLRRYSPVGHSVSAFRTAGLIGNYTRVTSANDFFSSELSQLRGGIFGELGAAYLVSSHLSLGAAASGEVTYGINHLISRPPATEPSQSSMHVLTASGGTVRVLGTLYF